MKSLAVVMGTRPDIIKLAPVAMALEAQDGLVSNVVLSGQHTRAALYTLAEFPVSVFRRFDLSALHPATLATLTGELLARFDVFLEEQRPDLVVVHGDVATSLAAALTAFYRQIPVAHVEAGLRTSRFESPHPEEGIRRMISKVTTLHFAPTTISRDNLLREHIPAESVFVTGNTVIDALRHVLGRDAGPRYRALLDRPFVVVTAHRRETYGSDTLER